MKPKLILWDWNGTLLDDLQYAIGVRNRAFEPFHLPKLRDIDEYYEQFTFPVRLYYERAGVTDDIFDDVAHAWMDEYIRGYQDISLFDDVTDTLDAFADAGCRQAVLSASEVTFLRKQLAFAGIDNRFDAILGLSHIYATSKIDVGREYLAAQAIEPSECAMIGDTLHDAEVARALGAQCVLVPRGHQSRAQLETAGVPVCASLAEAAALLLTE